MMGSGEGRVLNCLHENRPKLSPACRKEEIAISLMQSSNVELLPSLGAACSNERKDYCDGVRPGRARVLNCLLKNAEEVLTLLLPNLYIPLCVQLAVRLSWKLYLMF
jgi:Cysteine rich repeat